MKIDNAPKLHNSCSVEVFLAVAYMIRWSMVSELSRAERRRALAAERAAQSIRVCSYCGFGAVKGVSNSNLVKTAEGFTHATPVACAGIIAAMTSSTRSTFRGLLTDFWYYLKENVMAFLREDGSGYRRGYSPVASVENTAGGKSNAK